MLCFFAKTKAGEIEITGESEIDKTTSNSSLKCLANLFPFILNER